MRIIRWNLRRDPMLVTPLPNVDLRDEILSDEELAKRIRLANHGFHAARARKETWERRKAEEDKRQESNVSYLLRPQAG